MKHRNAIFGFILTALACAAFITCENNIMEKWWEQPENLQDTVSHAEGDYFTVAFNANGGTPEPDEQRIAKGAKLSKVDPMTNGNRGFGGWYKDSAFTEEWNFATDVVDKNITLHARWGEEDVHYVKVIFNISGMEMKGWTQNVIHGQAIPEPNAGDIAAKIPAGNGFDGWYKDAGYLYRWNFKDNVTDNNITISGDTVTLYARWTTSFYEVTFVENGGKEVPDQKIAYNGGIINVIPLYDNNPKRFAGWYTEDTYQYQWNFANDVVQRPTTLYAKWEDPVPDEPTPDEPAPAPIIYTVEFLTDGQTVDSTRTIDVLKDSLIPQPGIPTAKDGSIFSGWYTENTYQYQWNFATYPVEESDVNGITLKLYAKWTPPTITTYTKVIFNISGMEMTEWTQNVINGQTIPEPNAGDIAAKIPAGNGFDGWYKDDKYSYRWNFKDNVTDNNITISGGTATLYARWTTNFYTVTFEENGGGNVLDQNIAYNGRVINVIPSIENGSKRFAGWYKGTSQWNFANDVVTGTMTLSAEWDDIVVEPIDIYTVEFITDGGEYDPIKVPENSLIPQPKAPTTTREGYIFSGWYTEDTYLYQWNFATYPIEESDVTGTTLQLYAKWTEPTIPWTPPPIPPTYTVEFISDGMQAATPQRLLEGSKIVEPRSPVKAGNGFDGWYVPNSDKRWDFANDIVTANTVLEARWSQTFYTVNFSAQGAASTPDSQAVPYNGLASEPAAITRPGYGFGGWYTDLSFSKAWNFSSDTVSADKVTNNAIMLFARWVQSSYTVSFNANGGTPVPETQTLSYNSTIQQPASMTPPTGQAFVGWYTDSNSTTPWDFLQNRVTSSMTLHAKWETGVWDVTFDSYGGSAVSPQKVIDHGKALRPIPDPTKSGYLFKGWYTQPDPDGVPYNFDDPVTQSITLYARWVASNPAMAWISGGEFVMGGLSGTGSTTRPAHKVKLSGFYMMRTEVNQLIFDRITYWAREKNNPAYPDIQTLYTGNNYIFGSPEQKIHGFNPSAAQGEKRPVESVTWYDAVFFCNLLTDYENATARAGVSAKFQHAYVITDIITKDGRNLGDGTKLKDGDTPLYVSSIVSATVRLSDYADPDKPSSYDPDIVGYRLPTEAEWEYAARGGNGSPGNYQWAGSNTPNDVAWYGGSRGNTTITRLIGEKASNSFGLYDMSGNVCEWCWDWYDKGYYDISPLENPFGPETSPTGERSRRGGSIRHSDDNCRSQVRDMWGPGKSDNWNIGIRLVRTGRE